MYLVVFATLVIAILGTYTQVVAIEAGRIAAAQTGLAQAMLAWHTAAVSMAASIIDTNTTGYTGTACSLSNQIPSLHGNGFTWCAPPKNGATQLETYGIVASGSTPMFIFTTKGTGTKECVYLPSTSCPSGSSGCTNACTTTFDVTDYSFYSVLFNSSGTDYVITYAAPASGSSYLTSANNTQLNLTASGLVAQLNNLGSASAPYGTVNGTSIASASSFNFTLPSAAAIPTGAVALVTSPDGL